MLIQECSPERSGGRLVVSVEETCPSAAVSKTGKAPHFYMSRKHKRGEFRVSFNGLVSLESPVTKVSVGSGVGLGSLRG